jgi:hypothetical protein
VRFPERILHSAISDSNRRERTQRGKKELLTIYQDKQEIENYGQISVIGVVSRRGYGIHDLPETGTAVEGH